MSTAFAPAGTFYSDQEIRQEVEDELLWDSRVRTPGIQVSVRDGLVTLTGQVESFAEKIASQEATHRVRGVLDVANEITVVPTGHRPDSEIAQAIRNALEWHRFVPHDRIQSTVSDGWVTLEGTVARYTQREDAEEAIENLEGVRGVTNRILVDPEQDIPEEVHEAILTALRRQAEREADRVEVEVRGETVVLNGRVRTWAEKRAVLGAAGHTPGIRSVEDHLRIAPYA